MGLPDFTPNDFIEEMEESAPDVYVRCFMKLPDKNGFLKHQKCILNLKTGDVFRARKIAPYENPNHRIVRQYKTYKCGGGTDGEDIIHYAYQKADITDAGITLTTWVYGDYINCPLTSRLKAEWYTQPTFESVKNGKKHDETALANVILSKPRIAAILIIDQDKHMYSWEDRDMYGFKARCGMDRKYLSQSLIKAVHTASDAKRIVNLTKSFKEYFEIGYIGANRYVAFNEAKDIPLFLKASELSIRNSAKQAQTDELAAIELKDHSFAGYGENTICYADKVNDEWTVLRWWVKVADGRHLETVRMYVNKKEAIHCRSNLKDRWVHSPAKIKATSFNADRVVLQSPDVFDGTKLEYFKNISTEMCNQSAALYMLTMYPEFEQLYKVGFDWLCDKYIASHYQLSWKNFVEQYCGTVNWGAKNVLRMLGVNHHQVEMISKYNKKVSTFKLPYWEEYYMNSIVRNLKNIFISDELNSIDNDTFDFIIKSMMYKERVSSSYSSSLARTYDIYGKDAIHFIKDLNSISNGSQSSTVTRNQIAQNLKVDMIYSDVMRMIQSGNYMDRIRPRFSSIQELVTCHEILVDLTNSDEANASAKKNLQYAEGFNKHKKNWEEFAWEGDDTYCVLAPKSPIDIAVEGITLRHCVKSFIPAVSSGETNILFIRKKGDEETPFFTVEVDNRKAIRQVHGSCNCNVTSVAGLQEFVKAWAKKKKLRYTPMQANRLYAPGTY